MSLVVCIGCAGLCLSAVGVPLQQVKPQQPEKAGREFRLEELLNIDFESQRKDLFARCSAIAERYEASSESSFAAAISELEAYCRLDKQQRRKLDLAVRGSAKHTSRKFQQEVEATARIKSHQEAYNTLSQLASRMRDALANPTRSSFWQTAIQRTLTAEQLQRLKQNREARDAFLKEAWVIDVVRETDRHLRLRLEQREQLLEHLREWVKGRELPEVKRSYRGPWKTFETRRLPSSFCKDWIPNAGRPLLRWLRPG